MKIVGLTLSIKDENGDSCSTIEMFFPPEEVKSTFWGSFTHTRALQKLIGQTDTGAWEKDEDGKELTEDEFYNMILTAVAEHAFFSADFEPQSDISAYDMLKELLGHLYEQGYLQKQLATAKADDDDDDENPL
jgi:hypothetical protein